MCYTCSVSCTFRKPRDHFNDFCVLAVLRNNNCRDSCILRCILRSMMQYRTTIIIEKKDIEKKEKKIKFLPKK